MISGNGELFLRTGTGRQFRKITNLFRKLEMGGEPFLVFGKLLLVFVKSLLFSLFAKPRQGIGRRDKAILFFPNPIQVFVKPLLDFAKPFLVFTKLFLVFG